MTPRCLAVGATDSSGGAGIAADLKAFAAAGCHGMCAITGVTAQSTTGIVQVEAVSAAMVRRQIDVVFADIGVTAVKTGALLNSEIVSTVADSLRDRGVPIVVDPVLSASAGGALLDAGGQATLVEQLFPLAAVVTPNLDEAIQLSGRRGNKRDLAEALHQLGAPAVLVTGGHGTPVDHLFDGSHHVEIPVRRVMRNATHGTGCTHAATLAALLALGEPLEVAARSAARAVETAVLRGIESLGAGGGVVDVLDVRSRTPQPGGASQRRRTR